MRKLLRVSFLIAFALTPGLAVAQGGRGGGFGRGRGQRGQTDSTATGAPRVQLSFADMVFARRSDLQLTDSETIKVNDIRMSAMSQRAVLTKEVDSLQAVAVVSPGDAETPPTDSSRKATMSQRRALASKLGDLHDVDVNARNATLAVLTPDQQKKAESLEEAANSPAPQRGAFGGGGGNRGGGRPGGMGNP
jgi:hypothetical protein